VSGALGRPCPAQGPTLPKPRSACMQALMHFCGEQVLLNVLPKVYLRTLCNLFCKSFGMQAWLSNGIIQCCSLDSRGPCQHQSSISDDLQYLLLTNCHQISTALGSDICAKSIEGKESSQYVHQLILEPAKQTISAIGAELNPRCSIERKLCMEQCF